MLKSPRTFFFLFGLAALCVGSHFALGQNGPAVQLFTSSQSGETRLMPLEQLPVKVSVAINAGYDTNVGTTTFNQNNSFYSSASLGVSYPFGTERTRGSLSTTASVTYYDNGDQGGFRYDPNLGLTLALTHDVSERLTLGLNVYGRYGIEPDFAVGLGENRRSGNFFTSANSLSANYQWLERWSTVTTLTLSVVRYDDNAIGQFLNRYDVGFSQQVRFLVLPVTTAVADYRLGIAQYEMSGADSVSQYFLLGFDHDLGPHVRATLRGGVEVRSSDEQADDSVSPYGELSLAVAVGEKTSVNWNASYSKTDSNTLQASSSESFSTSLQARYSITPRISGTLAAFYVHSNNEGRQIFIFTTPSFVEQTVDIGVDFQYAISPRWSATAGSHYTRVWSELFGRDYSRARYYGGINYSF